MQISLNTVHKYLGLIIKEGTIVNKHTSLNFRCPFCGDSEKSEKKQRGNIKQFYDGNIIFNCFNCGVIYSIYDFFKEINPSVHKDFLNEVNELNGKMVIGKKKKKRTDTEIIKERFEKTKKEKEFNINNFLEYLYSRKIKDSDKCLKYIESRFIDTDKVSEQLYYIDNVHDFIKKFFKKDMKISSDGILIPAYSIEGDLVGFQIRMFSAKKLRYFGMKLGTDENMYFNIPNIDFRKDIFINEGFFDGCFIDNCISVPGITNIKTLIKKLKQFYKGKIYIVLDNEKNNKDVIRVLEECIKAKCYIYIWENVKDKDINDYAKRIGKKDITDMIKERSYKGLKAENELIKWKKKR